MKTGELTKRQAEVLINAVNMARNDKDLIFSMVAGYDWFFRLTCATFAGYIEANNCDVPFTAVYEAVKAFCNETWNVFRVGQKTKETENVR